MQGITLKNMQLFDIGTPAGNVCTGGNQEWYVERWHQMAGCGPVAASNLVWYQSRSRDELGGLCDVTDGGQSDFLRVMDDMFGYITPGKGGVHSSSLFMPGLLGYCHDRGFPMECENLEIPRKPRLRPSEAELRDFLSKWIQSDSAVAFLNLSNGSLQLPDSWHWVTILAFEPESMTALISDEGRTYEADMAKWLETSVLGGAFVSLFMPQN